MKPTGAEALSEIEAKGGKAYVHVCDVSNHQQIKDLFTSIGAINILVNNAGIAHVGKADNTSEEDFDKIVNVNIKEYTTVCMQQFHN